jgi:hypothetical protein
MRADLRPLVGIEKALEQGAENRRVDETPGSARPPSLILPHKSLRPGARKRGPGGGGNRDRA